MYEQAINVKLKLTRTRRGREGRRSRRERERGEEVGREVKEQGGEIMCVRERKRREDERG